MSDCEPLSDLEKEAQVVLPDSDRWSGQKRPLRLGVLGTLVWDRIFQEGKEERPVEEWGGISYAMEALSVVLPEGWVVDPILKLGEDLADGALDYISGIPRVSVGAGVQVVPHENYRVELRYQDHSHRKERLAGGVPPWTWEELKPHLDGIDALYLNFITGLEMGPETAQLIPGNFQGPLYADLHSLFQGISSEGRRFPRELPERETWLRAFDAVQMNEDEFDLLGGASGDPWTLAESAVGPELKLIAVTMGSKGAAFVTTPGFNTDPASWPGTRASGGMNGGGRTGTLLQEEEAVSGDPTGCGDVWGATFFARLLGGAPLDGAMRDANRLAAKKVEHQGARGLRHHLREVPGFGSSQ